MDEGGSNNGAFLSEKAQCGGPLEDMLRKAFLSIGTPLRTLEGIRLPEILRDKNIISRFLS